MFSTAIAFSLWGGGGGGGAGGEVDRVLGIGFFCSATALVLLVCPSSVRFFRIPLALLWGRGVTEGSCTVAAIFPALCTSMRCGGDKTSRY